MRAIKQIDCVKKLKIQNQILLCIGSATLLLNFCFLFQNIISIEIYCCNREIKGLQSLDLDFDGLNDYTKSNKFDANFSYY
jgi:hypothetical protein